MDTEKEKRFIREIKEAIKKSRGYADSFKWSPDRNLEEYYIVKLFCESLAKKGQPFIDISSIISRGRGNDPPDCEGNDLNGNLIGIEVTELVDSEAIITFKKNQVYEWTEWDKTKLINSIENRLDAKNIPGRIKGGPYKSYIIIIYTDEPVLNADYTKDLLKGYRFAKRNLIDRAFLFIFYDPIYKTYPSIELEFAI
jgi:hypothetical protein